MKATARIKRAATGTLSALVLATVLLGSVACTRGSMVTPGETTGKTPVVTTPGTSGGNGNGNGTHQGKPDSNGTESDKPLNPDAGTVDPNGNAGDPPTGTDKSDDSRSFRPRIMH